MVNKESKSVISVCYGPISERTYHPKSVGKVADFETLTLCIFLNSSQMCTYFCKDLVAGYYLYLVKDLIPNRHPFSN